MEMKSRLIPSLMLILTFMAFTSQDNMGTNVIKFLKEAGELGRKFKGRETTPEQEEALEEKLREMAGALIEKFLSGGTSGTSETTPEQEEELQKELEEFNKMNMILVKIQL